MTPSVRCPCGTGETYEQCCGRLHSGDAVAPTAVAVMRARYSAYALGHVEYLLRSWHPSTRPAAVDLEDGLQWTRLDVLATTAGGPFDVTGTVEFDAHHRQDGRPEVMHERSTFVREDGRWLYLSDA